MRPIFHPELVNGVFGDPALYVDLMFEKRGLLFDLGELRAQAFGRPSEAWPAMDRAGQGQSLP